MVHWEPCVTLAYSETCHIQNPGIFITQDIFRTLSRYILVYSECCVTLAYWEPCYIQNFAIFRILAYLNPRHVQNPVYYRHIQAYSGIFNNGSYNNANFLFFHFDLSYFSRTFKKACFLTTMTSISMLVWVYLNNMRSLKIALW